METILRELRVAERSLRRDPGFSIAAVLTLALGIAATTAVFSVLYGVLLAPLPYPDGEQLVRLYSSNARQGVVRGPMSGSDMWDYRAAASVAAAAPALPYEGTLEDDAGNPVRVPAYVVSSDFFQVFRTPMAMGRGFLPEEDAPGSPIEVVLSHQLWQTALGGDPSIVGRSITVEGGPVTVVGVTAPEMRYPRDAALWVQIGVNWPNLARRARTWPVVARLAPGVELEVARTELNTIAARLQREYSEWNTGWEVEVVPLKEALVGDLRDALLILMLASAGILLVAAANVANLLLARGAARLRETALRAALGAGRWQIVRGLFAEALVISVGGAAIGVLLAFGALATFRRLAPPQLAIIGDVAFGWQALVFAAVVTGGTTLVFGLLPAIRASAPDIRSLLGDSGGRATTGVGGAWLRSGLVVSEVAVATALVIGSGLLLKSFARLNATDPGFEVRDALTFNVAPPVASFGDFDDVTRYYEDLVGGLSSLPGVRGVAGMTTLPLSTEYDVFRPVRILDAPEPVAGEEPQAYMRIVTPGFFAVMGIPVIDGRAFNDFDTRDAAPVVVVNEAFARRNLTDGRVLNRKIELVSRNFGPIGQILNAEVEVVGVVGDVRYAGLGEDVLPAMYFPYAQAPHRRMSLLVAPESGDPASFIAGARDRASRVSSQVAISGVNTMDQVMRASTLSRRFTGTLLLVFGLVTLAMAMVGIYGVVSYQVTERVREMAVRMSIGATPGEVMGLILRSGARMWGLGIVVGVVGALALRRVLASQLFGVSASDPAVFAGAALILGVVAVAATSIPAFRSTRVEPAKVLREA